MKNCIFAIAIIVLFIGVTTLSAGAQNSDLKSTQLDKTHLRADISINDEYEWEYEFNIGRFYFGNKITITAEEHTRIMPFPHIGWIWDSDYYIEPGTAVEITSPYIRLKALSEYPPYGFLALAINVNVKEI